MALRLDSETNLFIVETKPSYVATGALNARIASSIAITLRKKLISGWRKSSLEISVLVSSG